MKISILSFKGETPKLTDNLLDSNEAQSARNCNMDHGDLRAWNESSEEEVLTGVPVAISLNEYDSDFITDSDDVDYIRSPIAGDVYDRMYFTGKTEPRAYSSNLTHPAYYKLGLPAPGAFSIASSGGGATTRAYAHTYVTSHGEEGPPSDIVYITNYDTGNVTFSGIDDAPADREIESIYLYRSNVAISGVNEFQFVLEATWFSVAVAYVVGDFVIYGGVLYKCTSTHAAGAWDAGHFTSGDDVTDAVVNTGEVCPSGTWLAPPTGLKGIICLSNGISGGFVGNEFYPSIPNMPHAWPDLSLSSTDTIIALGFFDTTFVLATDGYPWLVYGDHPTTMQAMGLSDFQPCLSKRSLASSKYGVIYASKEGLIQINQEGVKNITADYISLSDWNALTPTGINGHIYNNKYFGFNPSAKKSFIFDLRTGDFTRLDAIVYEGFVSPATGNFYVIVEELEDLSDPESDTILKIKQWEGDEYNFKRFTWKSKRFSIGGLINFAAARVDINTQFYDEVLAAIEDDTYLEDLNQTMIDNLSFGGGIGDEAIGEMAIGGDSLNELQGITMSNEVVFSLYTDGEATPFFTKQITNNDPFKLPGGKKYRAVEMEIAGYLPVSSVEVATDMRELCR